MTSVSEALCASVAFRCGDVHIDGRRLSALGGIDYDEFIKEASPFVYLSYRLSGEEVPTNHSRRWLTLEWVGEICGILQGTIGDGSLSFEDIILRRANELYIENGMPERCWQL